MRYAALALLVSLFAIPARAAEPDLKPAETYVVIAGVLQWPGSKISGFPTKNRKDEELYEVLRNRGVPADQMKLLLDEESTYSGVKRAIAAIASKAPAGSTFILYYCGHGMPCGKQGDICLANYDLLPERSEQTGLLASNLTEMIKASFHGKRVFLLADCCFSGGLGKTAEALHKAGFDAAAITSSNDSTISTRNWTYTQTVIDALKGDPFADANGDGVVSLSELNSEVKLAMGAIERQPSGYAAYGLKGDFKLAPAKPKLASKSTKFKPGDYVLVAGANTAGRVVDAAEDIYGVQFYDYTEKRRVEYAEAKLRVLPDGWEDRNFKLPAGGEIAEIEVEWNGQWYPATILKKDGDKTMIHYVGYGDNWDEWVAKERIRPLKK